jgi:hypothetical protein
MDGTTTKEQADRVVVEVDVFCANAATLVRSFMPTSLGKRWQREAEELEFLLTEIPMRFKRAIEKAQKKGWKRRATKIAKAK